MKATLAIEFDTTIKRDTTKLEQIANIINDNSTLCSNTSNSNVYETMTKQITDLKNQKEDLEKDIKRYNEQIKKEYAKIDKLNQDLEDKQDIIKKLEGEISDRDKKITYIEQTYEQLIKEEHDKYRELERNSTNELNKKSKEIQELKKKLEHYEPGGFNVGEEKFYYNEPNNRLIETMDDKAPYIAQAIDKNKCRFHFNTVSGPIKEACSSNRNLLMYCDIINEEPNASNIMRDEWGIASLTDSGDLIVESNAKIKLTRI